MKKIDNNKKENKLGLLVLLFSIIICLMTISYAALNNVYRGQKENTLTTETLILKLNEKSKHISLSNATPLNDRKGSMLEPYTFSLQNVGKKDINYQISIVNDENYYVTDQCTTKKLDWSFIRYSFTEGNTTPIINDLSNNSGILKTGVISASQEINYSLRLWLKDTTTNEQMGKHLHVKVKVEAIQSN